jgi:hypothetical protein
MLFLVCSAMAIGTAVQGTPVRIIFMHHSTGENLIWQGGMREAFTELGYEFWDHGYNSDGLVDPDGRHTSINWNVPGDNTDPDGWYAIFNQPFTTPPTNTLSHMLEYDVIIFKSCFPASHITDNEMFEDYKRYFLAIRSAMDQYPNKLFIPFTTPPLVPNSTDPESAARARAWAQHLTSAGYLGGYPNIRVFDFFTLLADDVGYLRAEYRPDQWDSHPNELANRAVGPLFVAFVDQAIQNFIPGQAHSQTPQRSSVNGDLDSQPEASEDTASQPEKVKPHIDESPTTTIDDFEGDEFHERWWHYADEETTSFSCTRVQPGFDSSHALQLNFDLGTGVYAGCGREITLAQNWDEAVGISFVWQANAPGLILSVVLMVEDTPFETRVHIPGTDWSQVTLRWTDFRKADWANEGGVETFDPVRVTSLSFGVGDWAQAQAGTILIDSLSLVVNATPTESSQVSNPPKAINYDKFALWVNGPHLRGANIWQRVVILDLDGPNFLGSAHVGPPFLQADFDRLAALGANYVNISHPGLFTERPPYVLDEAVQDNLDRLLGMAAAADLFAVISFRTGPGRSDFTFYRDGAGNWFDESLLIESVWQSQREQDAWVKMWRYTAQRYRNNPIVVGYDLMVEPNAASVALEIDDPGDFYPAYTDTLYDWNQFYPRIVQEIRTVDPDTPILVGAMGWSAVRWLPYLKPSDDTRTVYAVHQYEPQAHYTHQEQPGENTYPGMFDLDWDGIPDQFDRQWLDAYLSTIDAFQIGYGVPVAINEFGVMRWVPGAALFMDDQISLFEQRGLNHALWDFSPAWSPAQENDAFDFLHGPGVNNHSNVDTSALIEVILNYWTRNTLRPSNVGW